MEPSSTAARSQGVEQLLRPVQAQVPVVGYYPGTTDSGDVSARATADLAVAFVIPGPPGSAPATSREEVSIASENALRTPNRLKGIINDALDSIPPANTKLRPQRRIAAIQKDEVSGYRLGAEGPCPLSYQLG
jgi:hypothetical protein